MPIPPWSPRRSTISVHLLIQFGIDHNLGLKQCLAGNDLDIHLPGDSSGEIDAAQELSVVHNLVWHLGDTCAPGLVAGLHYHFNVYGIWGPVLLSSPTFPSAAQLGLCYPDLTFAFHGIRLEMHDDEAHLAFDDAGIPEDLWIFLLERDAGGVLHIQHDLTGQRLPILHTGFRRPPLVDPVPYVRELGLYPALGQADNRVVFRRYFLDLPLPGANPEVARAREEQYHALLARCQVRGSLAGRIRDRLLRTPGHLPDMQAPVMELHSTVRILHRRLDDEGSNYCLLLDEVRQALAEELLAAGAIRPKGIAEYLGYDEVSNFIYAFRHQKGMTPHQYRQQRRPGAMP